MNRLKISKVDEDNILLEAKEGIDHFGFGTFLCNIKANEIECDKFSKEALLSATAKRGLNGLEIWDDNRIAWGSPNHTIIMPINEISNMSKKDGWLINIEVE